MRDLRYEEWMDLLCQNVRSGDERRAVDDELSQKVRQALERLEPGEREALESFHFLGRSIDEISAEMNLTRRSVQRHIRSGTLKLRRLLAGYVQMRFGINSSSTKSCQICDSQNCEAAERILLSKTAQETWRRIIRELCEELNITAVSPSTLVGHLKYHRLNNID